MKFIMALNNT